MPKNIYSGRPPLPHARLTSDLRLQHTGLPSLAIPWVTLGLAMALVLPGWSQCAVLIDAVRAALLSVQHDLLTLNGRALHIEAGDVLFLRM